MDPAVVSLDVVRPQGLHEARQRASLPNSEPTAALSSPGFHAYLGRDGGPLLRPRHSSRDRVFRTPEGARWRCCPMGTPFAGPSLACRVSTFSGEAHSPTGLRWPNEEQLERARLGLMPSRYAEESTERASDAALRESACRRDQTDRPSWLSRWKHFSSAKRTSLGAKHLARLNKREFISRNHPVDPKSQHRQNDQGSHEHHGVREHKKHRECQQTQN